MATVLVHNSAWRSEAQARAAWPSATAVRDEFWWNLWRRRQSPYSLLADGTPIVLLDAWPGGGLLSWLVRARDVHVDDFPDKDAAVSAIARWAGESRRWVLSNPYTAARPADAGKTIFWRAAPVVRLDVPRPAKLAVARNGWLVTDDAELARWGVNLNGRTGGGALGRSRATGTAPGRRGQGRRLDVEAKLAIEARAMTVGRAWCRRQGWSHIKDVSRNESWDLEARDRTGRTRYVEVKGTTGDATSVEVTKGEVDTARRHGDHHALVIVYDIHVDVSGGRPVAIAGTVAAHDPWNPRRSELTAQRFTWEPAASRLPGS